MKPTAQQWRNMAKSHEAFDEIDAEKKHHIDEEKKHNLDDAMKKNMQEKNTAAEDVENEMSPRTSNRLGVKQKGDFARSVSVAQATRDIRQRS